MVRRFGCLLGMGPCPGILASHVVKKGGIDVIAPAKKEIHHVASRILEAVYPLYAPNLHTGDERRLGETSLAWRNINANRNIRGNPISCCTRPSCPGR
jgi:hypothetical protein